MIFVDVAVPRMKRMLSMKVFIVTAAPATIKVRTDARFEKDVEELYAVD